jgi:uncharacterized membrane protein YeaQ/YmgE (transglycosylase-associated protein family)
MVVTIVSWAIFGALAGWIAALVISPNKSRGIGDSIIVGIVGALIGGLFVKLFDGSGSTSFNIESLLIAIIGSITLLVASTVLRKYN